MKKEAIENINSELFNSFNPEDDLWVAGGISIQNTIARVPTTGIIFTDYSLVADYLADPAAPQPAP
jgi:hypothetical protein